MGRVNTLYQSQSYPSHNSRFSSAVMNLLLKSSMARMLSSIRITTNAPNLVHPSVVKRVNPFAEPIPVWLRDFKTFKPLSIIMASSKVFRTPVRIDIMHRIVHWHLASQRSGTASTKHRSDVRGSTRKLYRQKGTGRARAGSSRAPHRRGGATCFGPKPRKYSYTLPKKIRDLGLRSALSTKFGQGQLTFVTDDSIQLDSCKTRQLALITSRFPSRKALLIDAHPMSKTFELASRALKDSIVHMRATNSELNAFHLLKYKYVIMTTSAKAYYEQYFEDNLLTK